jgi:hypothetical protein
MRPVLARLAPNYFSSPTATSKTKYSNEKASTDPATHPKARFNPFASVSGVGKWFAHVHMDDSMATNNSGNVDSTVDSVDISPSLDSPAGSRKAKSLVTTYSASANEPTDSAVYA